MDNLPLLRRCLLSSLPHSRASRQRQVTSESCTTCGAERFTDAALDDCTSESGQHSFEMEPDSGVEEQHMVVEGDPA